MNEEQLRSALILVIDDQIANICLLQNILNRVGFTNIQGLTDSREAHSQIAALKPDLIVLDLNMPYISGLEVLQQLMAVMPRECYLPVLVLTADATAVTKRKALAAGATELLHKPFDASEVMMRIRNLLKTRFLHLEVQNQNAVLEQRVTERTHELQEAMAALEASQHQVLQQERLRAFSEMAGGVVHDFNNTLMSVIGYSDLLLSDDDSLDDRSTVVEYLQLMNTAGRDAAQVVSRLRDFYRPRELVDVFEPVDLNAVLERAGSLTQPKWRDQALADNRTIRLQFDLEKIPLVSANEAELREVATNLIFNAVDAMPQGGVITLRTRRCLDGGARAEFSDTGAGMTEEVRARCLEPFFSTKGENGTGLGLSMVFGIVKRHGALLEIESEPGKGATFAFQLPAAADESEASEEDADPLARSLRVLLVDDEPVTRHVVGKYLEMDGHRVVTVTNGREAMGRLTLDQFDLLLTDHAMPEMTGAQLAAAAKEMCPDLPVIILTGFEMAGAGNSENPPFVDLLLHKPIPQSALRRALRDVTVPLRGALLALPRMSAA